MSGGVRPYSASQHVKKPGDQSRDNSVDIPVPQVGGQRLVSTSWRLENVPVWSSVTDRALIRTLL